MNCPYCGITFSLDGVSADTCFPKFGRFGPYGIVGSEKGDKEYSITSHKCPECRRQIMWLHEISRNTESGESEIADTTLLLSGSNLLYLLEKHGHHAKIDLREAKKILSEKGK